LLSLLDQRQLVCLFFIVLVLLVLALLVNRKEAVESKHRTRGAKQKSRTCVYVDRSLVEQSGHHLRSNESLPDELIESQFVLVQETGYRVRRPQHRRWANRFVRVLGVLFRFVEDRFLGQVLSAELRPDIIANFTKRRVGNASRIGSHVGDQSDRAFFADLNAFVKPLRELHCLLHRKAELSRGFLLKL